MNGFTFFKRFGIRERALVLAITPLTIVSLVIGYYLVSTRLQDTREALLVYGESIARDLAKSSGFSLYVGDEKLLDSLISGALLNPDIDSISVCDSAGQLLAHRGPDSIPRGGCGESATGLAVFTQPISPVEFARDENPEFREPSSVEVGPIAPLGKVVVRVTFDALERRQREIIVKSSAFVLAGIALSALLGVLMANGLLGPLRRVTAAVSDIRRGDLSTRLIVASSGEIGELEAGINQMAQTLQDSQSLLQRRIDLATDALRNTIETLQVRNIELEVAREAAVKSGNAKAEFMAQISHELRTPLHAIIGFGELLESSVDDATALEYVRIIGQAGTQLLTVIDDVLTFSSLESDNFAVASEVFDPIEVLENVVSLFAHEAHRKNLELVLLCLDDAPRQVRGDAARLGQVLTNLLNNAIKFTERGHVIVTADSAPEPEDERRLRVSITDTGIGVAPAFRESLFQPFAQGDPSINKRYGGTGLGLAISRVLMQRMGGEIEYRADDGGSTFRLRLAGVDAPVEPRAMPLADKKILVIEAHPFSRRALRNTLLQFGARVSVRASGDDVVTRSASGTVEGQAFDAAVVGLSRAELADRAVSATLGALRQLEIPLLVLVGDERELLALRERYADSRCQLMTKPVRRATLLSALNQVMSGTRRGPRAVPRAEPSDPPAFSALIGDDNAFSRQLLGSHLQRRGGAVTAVMDGRVAIMRAMERRYDVIFLDIHMPDVDGLAACREIRQRADLNRETPIVAITADVYIDDKAGTLFDTVIHKPVTADEIGATLRRLLPGLALAEPRFLPASDGTASRALDPDGVVRALRAQFAALQGASVSMNRGQLKSQAHQLAGIAGFFGHAEWAALIRELEQSAEQAQACDIQRKVAAIGQAIDQLSGVDDDVS
ncbi:MAG: ATP-binding protein [Thiotrichales bacterium]